MLIELHKIDRHYEYLEVYKWLWEKDEKANIFKLNTFFSTFFGVVKCAPNI